MLDDAGRSRLPPRGRARRWFPWILGAALAGAVVVVATRFSEAREFVQLTERANGWWLVVALALQAVTYIAQGEVVGCVGRAGRFPLSLATLYRLSLAKLFVEQAVPSAGLSGTVMLASVLERRGMPRSLVATAVVVDIVSCYAAYILGLAAALGFTFVHGEANALIVVTSVVFILVGTALGAMALALSGRAPGKLARRVGRVRPIGRTLEFLGDADERLARGPRVLGEATVYQVAILVLDAATVWALIHSLGSAAPLPSVFASFMISTVFRTVGVLPGGLGAFEASSVLTLKMVGVALPVALAATLLFRGLSFWLPMLPGLWFSRR